jgi:hypothetical protein
MRRRVKKEAPAGTSPATVWVQKATCPECGKRLFISASGVSCEGGHGGLFSREDFARCGDVPEHGPYLGDYCPACDDSVEEIYKDGAKKVADVEETSKKLASALETAGKKESDDRSATARALVWESANAPKKTPEPPALARVVEQVFLKNTDVDGIYERLEKNLMLGDGRRTERGFVLKALDEAAKNHRDAHRLYITSKALQEDWERDNSVHFATLRSEANKILQSEKESGRRNKSITDADIEAKMAELFPDEWRSQETRRARLKLVVESMKSLVESWEMEHRTLNTMASRG